MVAPVRSFSDRIYMNIPIEQIRVLNSRGRDRSDFEKNIQSIKDVGLLTRLSHRSNLKDGSFWYNRFITRKLNQR
jgi:hypothetical protein